MKKDSGRQLSEEEQLLEDMEDLQREPDKLLCPLTFSFKRAVGKVEKDIWIADYCCLANCAWYSRSGKACAILLLAKSS